jgi:hypothetical protein
MLNALHGGAPALSCVFYPLVRENRRPDEGDGVTEVIFPSRSNMSYQEIRDYLWGLQRRSEVDLFQIQIDPAVIDPNRIRAVEHFKPAGLQVAGAVASGSHFAPEVNRHGETEPAYLPHLKKTVYRHKALALR